jgi:peptidoglycan/xylan/chitin deacetylase (PgdA/CDA1 family)
MGISATLFITTGPVETRQEFNHDLIDGTKGFLPLTWDQIRYWSTRGVEFGSHTRSHVDCGTLGWANLQSEIVGSKNDLESQLGKPVGLFAFPYGQRENISLEAMQLAASAYTHFVSCFGGEDFSWSRESQCHLFRKKLYNSRWELELELQSVFDFVDAVKMQFRRLATASAADPVRVPAVSRSTAPVSVSSLPRNQ